MMHRVTFRAGVGAIILNAEGQVLAFRRTKPPQVWQMPQGGMDRGEDPRDTVFREVEEETGITRDKLALLDEHPDWVAYEFPPERRSDETRGQIHKWFVLRFEGDDADIDPEGADSAEFSEWRWMAMTELAEETAFFKRDVYRKLLAHFADRFA